MYLLNTHIMLFHGINENIPNTDYEKLSPIEQTLNCTELQQL